MRQNHVDCLLKSEIPGPGLGWLNVQLIYLSSHSSRTASVREPTCGRGGRAGLKPWEVEQGQPCFQASGFPLVNANLSSGLVAASHGPVAVMVDTLDLLSARHCSENFTKLAHLMLPATPGGRDVIFHIFQVSTPGAQRGEGTRPVSQIVRSRAGI